MKIEFKKINKISKKFNTNYENINFFGEFSRDRDNLINISAKIDGKLQCNCDRCAKGFDRIIDEDLEIKVSEGIYEGKEDVFEVFSSNTLDFLELLKSELELIKNDYNHCKECNHLDYFETEY